VREPCGTAYPSAQDVAAAGVEPIPQLLRTQKPAHFGRPTARKLVELAHGSVSSNRALSGRSTSLRILCDLLEHTQANLARLQAELEQLIAQDPGVKGLEQIPEFGPKTVAVLRAELGEVNRLSRTDEVMAYGGMDIEIKESGHRIGKAKRVLAWQWVSATSARAFRRSEVFTWRGPPLAPPPVVWCSGVGSMDPP